jgi:transposase
LKFYHVTLTPAERAELDRLIRVGKGAAIKLAKARILLAADEAEGGPAQSDTQIMASLRVSKNTVCRTRERLVEEGIEAALNRKPSTQLHTRKLDGRAEAHLVAMACAKPPQGRARWTLRLLADQMVAADHVDSLSYETVRQVLKKTRSNRG